MTRSAELLCEGRGLLLDLVDRQLCRPGLAYRAGLRGHHAAPCGRTWFGRPPWAAY